MTGALRSLGCVATAAWLGGFAGAGFAQSPPAITVQPYDQAACLSGSAVLFVAASGSGPVSFQWRRDAIPIFAGVSSTPTNSSLTIPNLLPPDTLAQFDVVVSDFWGAKTSAVARVFFSDPALYAQPQPFTNFSGGQLSFSALPCGTGPHFFQWFFNDAPLTNGGRFSGATDPLLTVHPATDVDDGTYQVAIHNQHRTVFSEAVQGSVVTAPTIVQPPESHAACYLGDTQFKVQAQGTPPLIFEWYRDGTNVTAYVFSTPTNSVLVVTNVQFADTFSTFHVMVSNAHGFVQSDPVQLTVPYPAPAFAVQPTNVQAITGSTIELHTSVCAGGTPADLTYQWFRNSSPLLDGGNINGALTNVLRITGAVATNAGLYEVIATWNGFYQATSVVAQCWVGTPPTVGDLTSRVVRVFASTAFNPTYTGTLPRRYQWYRNGIAIPGATSSSLARNQVQRHHVGLYQVVVTNNLGVAVSGSAQLQVRLTLEGTPVVFYEEATDELVSLTNAVPSFFTPPPTTLYHGVPLLFTTYGATAQSWETNHCGVPASHSMWVRYTSRGAGTTRVTTEGSSFNTVLAVYTWNGNPNSLPVPVACNDNGGYDGRTSRLVFTNAAFTDYYIAVDGVGGATGTVRLQVGENIRKMIYDRPTDSLRFEYSGPIASNNVLRLAASLAPSALWSNLITVPPTNMDWVRYHTNTPVSPNPERYFKLEAVP